jgi:aryl-alcohol dehydrogenase-like predicted oxidoreductase
MPLRPLGRTSLVVSRLGLGLAALGRPGYLTLGHAADLSHDYDVATMAGHTHAILDAARALGVRYIDAARSYGRAEEFLAAWLSSRTLAPETMTIGSKWGYTYTAGWRVDAERHEVKDHSQAVLGRQWSESKALLGTYLSLYQIHSATLESGVLDDPAVLGDLARLRREEGVRIGLTLSGPRQAETLRRAMEVRSGGARIFDCVQATWNLLESSAGEALHEAHEAGVGVIVKEGVANGRLTDRNQNPAFASSRRRLEEQAQRLGTTLDALALAAVLAQPWADVVLSGAATVEQLRSNAAALAARWDDEAAARLRDIREDAEEYWTMRGRLAWN